MEKYWEIKNFLSEQECLDILKKYKSELNLQPGEVYSEGNKDLNNEKRKSSVAFVKNIELIDDRLKKKLDELINLKGFNVTGLGPYQFTEYKPGEFYDWHTDSTDKVYKERFASIVILLNDNYTEGFLEIKIDGEIKKFEKLVGSLFVFYSNMIHRVSPVGDGVRYSLVNWVSLEKIEGFKQTLI